MIAPDQPKPVGVFGGTFDPVHNGHLRVALEALEALDLAEVRLLPSRQPPHRGRPGATPEQRLTMLERAVAGQPGFVLDRRELERDGPSYMVDTLSSLRAELAATPLCLLLGGDAFRELPGWHRWQTLFELAHVVVLRRPRGDGDDDDRQPRLPPDLCAQTERRWQGDARTLRTALAGEVYKLSVTQLDISATRIRELLRQNRSPRYLVPDTVLDYIESQNLYR